MTRQFIMQTAARKNAPIKIGLTGESGSGKTHSALLIAFGLVGDWKKIALFDTENGRGNLFSDLGEYNHIPLDPPFNPEAFEEAITYSEGIPEIEVIIFDSFSHEYEGVGGILEIVQGAKNSWLGATARHRKLIDKMLRTRLHIISTLRGKNDVVYELDERGKNRPKVLGTKASMKPGFEFEQLVMFELSPDRMATIKKAPLNMFPTEPTSFLITKQHGERVKEWLSEGVDPGVARMQLMAKAIEELSMSPDFQTKRKVWAKYPDFQGDPQFKNEFLSELNSELEKVIGEINKQTRKPDLEFLYTKYEYLHKSKTFIETYQRKLAELQNITTDGGHPLVDNTNEVEDIFGENKQQGEAQPQITNVDGGTEMTMIILGEIKKAKTLKKLAQIEKTYHAANHVGAIKAAINSKRVELEASLGQSSEKI